MKWASIRKEFTDLRLDEISHNWEASFHSRVLRIRKVVVWS